jgi:hypothetical protein
MAVRARVGIPYVIHYIWVMIEKTVPRVTTRASFEHHTFLGLFLGSAESRTLSWEETHLPGQGRGEKEESKVDARDVARRQCQ